MRNDVHQCAAAMCAGYGLRRHLARREWTITYDGGSMLRMALGFFIIAIIAAVLGFGGIAGAAVGIAKILFFIFLIGFLITLVLGLMAGRAVVK